MYLDPGDYVATVDGKTEYPSVPLGCTPEKQRDGTGAKDCKSADISVETNEDGKKHVPVKVEKIDKKGGDNIVVANMHFVIDVNKSKEFVIHSFRYCLDLAKLKCVNNHVDISKRMLEAVKSRIPAASVDIRMEAEDIVLPPDDFGWDSTKNAWAPSVNKKSPSDPASPYNSESAWLLNILILVDDLMEKKKGIDRADKGLVVVSDLVFNLKHLGGKAYRPGKALTVEDVALDVNFSDETLLHELGHAFGQAHTGTKEPSPPCEEAKVDGIAPWVKEGKYTDNRLHKLLTTVSGTDIQMPYDVKREMPVPERDLEVMAYCNNPDVRSWISSFTYAGMFEKLIK